MIKNRMSTDFGCIVKKGKSFFIGYVPQLYFNPYVAGGFTNISVTCTNKIRLRSHMSLNN